MHCMISFYIASVMAWSCLCGISFLSHCRLTLMWWYREMPPKWWKVARHDEGEGSVNRSCSDAPPPPPPPPPSPPMPDLGQFVVALMATIPREAEWVKVIGCSLATFFRHNSPVFDGREGPMAGDEWVTVTTCFFFYTNLNESSQWHDDM
jgi:hypothetical protein